MMIAQIMPMNHARKVFTGIVVSSVLATAARTSGYGESSSVNESETLSVSASLVSRSYLLTEALGFDVEVWVVEVSDGRDLGNT